MGLLRSYGWASRRQLVRKSIANVFVQLVDPTLGTWDCVLTPVGYRCHTQGSDQACLVSGRMVEALNRCWESGIEMVVPAVARFLLLGECPHYLTKQQETDKRFCPKWCLDKLKALEMPLHTVRTPSFQAPESQGLVAKRGHGGLHVGLTGSLFGTLLGVVGFGHSAFTRGALSVRSLKCLWLLRSDFRGI